MSDQPIRLAGAQLTPWRAELPVVSTARGAIADRRGWWLDLTDDDGRTSRGEAAPLPNFGGESRADCVRALQSWAAQAAGTHWPVTPRSMSHAIDAASLPPVARAAVSQALFGLLAERTGCSVAELLAEPLAEPLAELLAEAVSAGLSDAFSEAPTLRGKNNAQPRRLLPESHRLVTNVEDATNAVKAGVSALKVKVAAPGVPVEVDLARLRAIRAGVGDAVALRLDANGGWSALEVRQAWSTLQSLNVQWIEEPCDLRVAAHRALVCELRGPSGPLVLADESVRDANDLQLILGAVDGVVVKPMLVGGVDVGAQLAATAATHGLGVVVTTSFGTTRDLAASVAVARTSTTLWGCGLDARHATVRPLPQPNIAASVVPHPVAAAARQRPHHPALRTDRGVLTWQQLAEGVAQRAAVLRQQGVRAGDVVTIAATPTAEGVQWMHAITWCGAILAPLDVRAPAATRTRHQTALRPDFRLLSEPDSTNSNLPGIAIVTDVCTPRLDHTERVGEQPTAALAAAPWPMAAPRIRLLTSGTTGAPTLIDWSASQLLCSVMGSTQRLGHRPDDVWLDCLPLHHAGGLSVLLRCAWLATTTDLRPRFDAPSVLDAILRGTCTQLSLVPMWLEALLDVWPAHTAPHPKFRIALIGGAALPADLRARATAVGLPIAESWGLTEAASQVATRAPWDEAESGPGAPLCVTAVSTDADGRLRIHGPLVAAGELRTGDRGRLTDAGLRVDGRADAGFQSGGELVEPQQIEAALCAHHAIEAALVVGLADSQLGHRTAALIVVNEPTATAASLTTALRTELRSFLIPRPLHVVQSLPRTPMDKPDRVAAGHLLAAISASQNIEKSGDQTAGEAVVDPALLRNEVGRQRSSHAIGERPGTTGLFDDAGVHVAHEHAGPVAVDCETEGDRARAEPLNDDRNAQHLAESHGPLVVGLDVDERQDPRLVRQDLGEREPGVDQQRLKGDVGVLEGPAEEDDPDGIDLGESNVMVVDKLHGDDSRQGASTQVCQQQEVGR